MEQNSINQRLNSVVDVFEKGKKAAFARKAGISPQGAQEILAGRKGDPSFKVLVKVLESYPMIDANWLVLGQGQMLRDAAPVAAPASLPVELAYFIQEYVQVSKQLEDKKATHRQMAAELARRHDMVQHYEAVLRLQMEQLPNFDQEAQKLLQTVIQTQQEALTHAREHYTRFLDIHGQVDKDLLEALKYQGELEKKLNEFIGSAVPLTMEEQMKAISARHQLVQAVNSPSV